MNELPTLDFAKTMITSYLL